LCKALFFAADGAQADGVDTKGDSFEPVEVTAKEGGN